MEAGDYSFTKNGGFENVFIMKGQESYWSIFGSGQNTSQ